MRRALAAGLLGLAIAAAACAPKTAPLPPPAAAGFPEFIYPAPPAGVGSPAALERHDVAWKWLQAGEFRAADRNFGSALKQSPDFYPAEAGLGYSALARKDYKEAVTHFDRAIVSNPRYAPALAGRGEALLALGEPDRALKSLEAALAADPELTPLRSRVEVLRVRGLQDSVAQARKAADAGRFADARRGYEQAIASSPQSPFLYRELATVERRDGNLAAALTNVQKAAELEPTEPRNQILAAEILQEQGDLLKAADAYAAANALEPNEAIAAKIDELRERSAFAAMPEEYRAIESSPTLNRAQLAALLGVRLDELVKGTRQRDAVVITDTRSNWAAPWILAVARAGLMEVYPNHTFQPDAIVRRGDLAQAASRALSMIATANPRSNPSWRNARRKFPDVSPGHLSYPAASMVVEAGVMPTLEDGSFQLARPVTGAEAAAAVKKLGDLAGRTSR